MADVFTPFANLGKPEVGSSRATWGTTLNNTIDTIDAKFSSDHTDILARLRLDGAVPMQGNIRFANNDQGIVLSAGTRLIDHTNGNTGLSEAYCDVAGSDFMFRTADGTGEMLHITLDKLTYRGRKILDETDGGKLFLPIAGGTLTGPLKAPEIDCKLIGHDDGQWVDYISGVNAILQFSPDVQYIVNRQTKSHNWTTSGNVRLTITNEGNLVCSGDVTAFSDIRLKDNIEPIANAIDLLGKLRPVAYTYKADGRKALGLIAQEVEAVSEVAHTVINDATGYKTIAYSHFIAPLIAAVNELSAKVKALEAKLHG